MKKILAAHDFHTTGADFDQVGEADTLPLNAARVTYKSGMTVNMPLSRDVSPREQLFNLLITILEEGKTGYPTQIELYHPGDAEVTQLFQALGITLTTVKVREDSQSVGAVATSYASSALQLLETGVAELFGASASADEIEPAELDSQVSRPEPNLKITSTLKVGKHSLPESEAEVIQALVSDFSNKKSGKVRLTYCPQMETIESAFLLYLLKVNGSPEIAVNIHNIVNIDGSEVTWNQPETPHPFPIFNAVYGETFSDRIAARPFSYKTITRFDNELLKLFKAGHEFKPGTVLRIPNYFCRPAFMNSELVLRLIDMGVAIKPLFPQVHGDSIVTANSLGVIDPAYTNAGVNLETDIRRTYEDGSMYIVSSSGKKAEAKLQSEVKYPSGADNNQSEYCHSLDTLVKAARITKEERNHTSYLIVPKDLSPVEMAYAKAFSEMYNLKLRPVQELGKYGVEDLA